MTELNFAEMWKERQLESFDGEVWRPIIEYENLYQISNYGRIKNIKKNVILKSRLLFGYVYVGLNKNSKSRNFRVHKLVIRHFLSEPPLHNSVVGHYDNIKCNNFIDNLYWTTSRDNTIKAIEDGLLISKLAEDNHMSFKVKVLDKKTNEIVGVYGSIRECSRCIENSDESFIAVILWDNINIKPRSKKYKYLNCSDTEFYNLKHLKSAILTENIRVDKRPSVFDVTFPNGEIFTFDNQTQASIKTGIKQATISHLIKSNGEFNGYKFKFIKKINYKDSSAYASNIKNKPSIIIKNIFTNEIKEFRFVKDLKEYFGLTGNDIMQYRCKNQLINSEWSIL